LVATVLIVALGTGCTAPREAVDPAPTTAPTTTPTRSGAAATTPLPSRTQASPTAVALTANPLYRAGSPASSGCREPAARPTSVTGVRAFYAAAVACLDRSWAPVVRRAGFAFRAPKLVVTVGRPASPPCDLADNHAIYCHDTIYIDAARDLENYRQSDPSWTLASMAFLIGHEYGHHVQALTGMLNQLAERLSVVTGTPAHDELLRRMELQASCLSGVFFGANRSWFPAGTSRLENWQWTVRHTGDDSSGRRDHGSKTNHNHWSLAGLTGAAPARCNTFSAPPELVS
jgi:predicted metalloprotease